MKYLRYYSGFYSRDNIPYRIEIWQDAEAAFDPERITLAADPVEIEWAEVDKLEPVHSSSATLNMVSLSDRCFADLYTVAPGTIRLDILRNGALYWSGTLDTELFEEPYSYKDRYITTVTFSDFAVLDRMDWQDRGVKTMSEVLETCLAAAGFNRGVLEKRVSTGLAEGYTGDLFDDCSLMCDNFFDEDDEPSSIREVLDEMLRPFALRLKQKNGKLLLYDINGIYDTASTAVQWRGTDAEMGVEPVYNKVTITFSPYASATLFDGTLAPDDILTDQADVAGEEMVYTDRTLNTEGFRFTYGASGTRRLGKLELTDAGGRPFRIDPEYSGSNAAGVMWGYRTGTDWHGSRPQNPVEGDYGTYPTMDTCHKMITLPKVRVLSNHDANGRRYRMRVTLSVLFDVRYNPFEPASRKNEEGNWDDFANWVNYGYIPVRILLYDDAGKARYYYDNHMVRWNEDPTYGGTWKMMVESTQEDIQISWLSFYDLSNRESNTGFGGWQENKRALGYYSGKLTDSYIKAPTGELLPSLPISGYIEVMIYSGVWRRDNNDNYPFPHKVWTISRWLLYKDPKIEIVKDNGRDIEEEDIEVSAWINRQAKEGLDISTIIGTSQVLVPSGRGYILKTSDLSILQTFHRASVTDSLERLLAGTVYSNYARRMSTLNGTVALIPSAEVLSDVSSDNAKYMLLSEVQNLAAETSEIKMAEIAPDSYEGIEYEK
jgi:hypothetical protein|nr:MAG TPA: hypothetical protein [Bacteriophage sp.]